MERHPERMIYFQIAEKLGMTVSGLLRKMSSMELTEWIAYFNICEVRRKQAMNKG